MLSVQERANVLIEAIPYLMRYYNKIVVIKYGGHAMVDDTLKEAFAKDILFLKQAGIKPVIVHGGGPEINRLMKMVGKEPKFLSGLRVTDAESIELVEMVLSGKINKEIVASITHLGGKAIGLSGKDAHSIRARKHTEQTEACCEVVDLGYVGEVESIDPHIINVMVNEGYVPVISPIGLGLDGCGYNINADIVAGTIAAALRAEKYICITDVVGILEKGDDPSTLISQMTLAEAKEALGKPFISGGMIPKLQSCITALEGGVQRAHILDGRIPHAILIEMLTNEGIGTMVWSG
ncbi:MAG: acetylglutamate kinase [Candidatus Methanofastidiosa archaeon]|nr:acetylglutamate kinase [Candidatus Methanofastidiosa archaeon]